MYNTIFHIANLSCCKIKCHIVCSIFLVCSIVLSVHVWWNMLHFCSHLCMTMVQDPKRYGIKTRLVHHKAKAHVTQLGALCNANLNQYKSHKKVYSCTQLTSPNTQHTAYSIQHTTHTIQTLTPLTQHEHTIQ